jgi:hypothetical protein
MMEDQALLVFALDREVLPLRLLRDALREAGYPAGIGIGIVGGASDAELDATDWDAAFVRWNEPEVHEVYLIERETVGGDAGTDRIIAQALTRLTDLPESAGKLIVADHLSKTQTLYSCQVLPALFADEDHPAWAALDVVLRCLAETTDGIIYAEAEGYYDPIGDMLLDETEEEDDEQQ